MTNLQYDPCAGEGEIRALLRRYDWANFALGAPDGWPIPLQTAFRLMLDSDQPTSLLWGDDLSFFYNDSYQAVLGNKHPQALGQPFWEVWREVEDVLKPAIDQTLAGKSVYAKNVPFRILRNEQVEDAWFTYTLLPLRNEAGTVVGVFNPCQETTDQVETERRASFLLKLASHLRALTQPDEITAAANEWLGTHLDIARVFYAEVNDAKGSFVIRHDWTRTGLAHVSGEVRTLDEFGGDAMSVLRRGEALVVDDVARDPRTAAFVDAYERIGVRAFMAIPYVRSGTLRVVLNLHQSEPCCWTRSHIALSYDVAERTWAAAENARANQELRVERDRSQAVFDTMVEGFGMLDRDWVMLYMNAEGLRIGNREGQQVIGRDHWELWPDTLGTDLERMYRRVMKTRQPETLEFQHFWAGRAGWLEVRAYPGIDDGLSIFFRDVSSRKETDEKLRSADRRKDDFLAMLAHELRNPLAPISAAAQLLQLGNLTDERVRKTSEVIGRQVSHMTGLIDDLLDVSRVTRGLIELDETVLDIRHVVNDAVEQVSPLIRARGHELVIRHGPRAGGVRGDQKRLVQVIANVLNNAAKYTADGGHLVLCTVVRESEVLIEVIDDGIGMTPETCRHAFDLFTQAERSSDRSTGGLGLGLSLVRSLVELHGGAVSCRSEGLGKGSTFSIVLPRLPEPADRAVPDPAAGAASQADAASLRILVVDDNVDAADMLALVLTTMGHQVETEYHPDRALEMAGRFMPHVYLLDIGLPDIDGYELTRRLRARSAGRDALIVAVTGYGQDSDRQAALAAGFDHHLVKPVDAGALFAILSGGAAR